MEFVGNGQLSLLHGDLAIIDRYMEVQMFVIHDDQWLEVSGGYQVLEWTPSENSKSIVRTWTETERNGTLNDCGSTAWYECSDPNNDDTCQYVVTFSYCKVRH